MNSNIKFMIFDCSELSAVNFTEVMEDSIDSIRRSKDETKTFVKWIGNTPTSIASLTTKQGPYSYSEITNILSSTDWSTSL